jgi:hypothetical protein
VQPENGALVEELGVGRCLPLAALTAHELTHAMHATLADGEVKRRSEQIAHAMRQVDSGAAGAARLVESAAALFDGDMRRAAASAMGARFDAPTVARGEPAAHDPVTAPGVAEADEGWGDELD